MIFATALENVTELFSAFRGEAGKADSHLTQLDFGILQVALMIAAVDGKVMQDELKAFASLSKRCRGWSEKAEAEAFDRALRGAGYLLLLGQAVGRERVLEAFVKEAVKALPDGFAYGSPRDVRKAFVMWAMMAASDGEYSDVERAAIGALRDCLAARKSERVHEDEARWMSFSTAYRQTGLSLTEPMAVKLLPDEFFAELERCVVLDGAERALAELIDRA